MLKRLLFGFILTASSHLVMAQMTTRFSYSEAFGIAEGLAHNVIANFTIDQNDLVWIAVNSSLQLFDGDQFVDMNHLINKSNSTGSFGYDHGKDVFFLKQNILYKLTSDQYTSKEAPSYVFPSYSRRERHPKIIYEDSAYLYISHPNDSLYQIDKKSLLAKHVYLLPHSPHPTYGWSSIYIQPEPVKTIQYLDSTFLKCSFELATGKTIIDQSGSIAWRAAVTSGDTMLVLQTDTLAIFVSGHKRSVALPETSNQFNGDQFLIAGRDSVFFPLGNAIYVFNLRLMKWTSKLQHMGGLVKLDGKVRKMVLDKTGHLYISTFNSGLIKMYPSNNGFQYLGTLGTKKYFIKCIRVSEKNNLVLAGTLENGLLVFDTNGILKHHLFQFPDTQSLRLVSSIIKLSEDRYILFSNKTFDLTFSGEKYVLRELADSTRYRSSFYDNAIEDDIRKRYLVFNHRQIIEIRPDDPFPILTIQQFFLGSCTSATINGGLYVRSALDELTFYNQDLHPHSIKFNVPDFGYSRCLVPYAPSQFLVATDIGIFLLDTLHPEAPNAPIYDHMVYSILPGKKEKEFWFSTDYGLYRLDADLGFKRYAIESGLQESEFNTNSCYKSQSGKLYFGGINGITAFYPDQLEKEEDKPLPYISIFSVNGQIRERYIDPESTPHFNLAYNENVIQIRLLGKGERSPKSYNFQYMVKGLHEKWNNLGRNMDIQLQLVPGNYTIYFHIADSFEPDAEPLHALAVKINPPFYQRWWFILAMGLIPLYFLYYYMNLRRKRLALKLAYVQELDKKLHEERMRISRDLHDNIGAQMATVKRGINFIIDQGSLLTTEQTNTKMKDLETISTQINQELRDTIWAVQNEQITISGFITRLKNYVYQLTGPESNYRITYTTPENQDTLLGPFTALNLHRICQESLNNIMKHAGATEIHISFEHSSQQLKITIIDNGKGYHPAEVKEGYGLGNIRYRAEQIGANIFFNRIQQSGSSIEIVYKYHTISLSKSSSDE